MEALLRDRLRKAPRRRALRLKQGSLSAKKYRRRSRLCERPSEVGGPIDEDSDRSRRPASDRRRQDLRTSAIYQPEPAGKAKKAEIILRACFESCDLSLRSRRQHKALSLPTFFIS